MSITTKISPKYALTKGTLLNTVAMATSTKKIIRAAKKYLELNFIGLSNIFQLLFLQRQNLFYLSLFQIWESIVKT